MSAEQDAIFAQLLAEMALLPHGATASYNPSGSGGDSSESQGGKRPPGESYPEQERLRDEYIRCWTDHGRDRVIEKAREYLRTFRGYGRKRVEGENATERDARIVKSYEGWSDSDVANAERMLPREVRRIRQAADREPATGKPNQPARISGSTTDRYAEIQRLLAAGHTTRQITLLLGCGPATVDRARKAA